jgi:hypothetical protein
VLAFDVKIDVVSEKATVESDDAATANDTELPADTVPMLPAAVEKVGEAEADKIAEDDLTALPSLFSTLIK